MLNLNFPKKTDSWMILGPGRTGSRFICSIIAAICTNSGFKIKHIYHRENIDKIESGTIYHRHKPEDIKYINDVTLCIISTRDMVESALSEVIGRQLGQWHFYSQNEINKVLDNKYYIDPLKLLDMYNYIKRFYEGLSQYDISKAIIIDYSEFQNNKTKLIKKLNYSQLLCYGNFIPIKTPKVHKNWINNWDEISEVISTLERNPRKFF